MIDFYKFEKCIVIGDLNSDPKYGKLDPFLDTHMLHSHLNSNTCFKSDQGSCIDLILSNQKYSIQCTGSFDCGLSDHHHLVYTMLKSIYTKPPPKLVSYRCYKNFSETNYIQDLNLEFAKYYTLNLELNIEVIEHVLKTVLDIHAPLKSKYIRGNEKPHMNRSLKRAIMKRTRLWNKYRKTKNSSDLNAYRVQRNIITKMNKKAKLDHFSTAVNSSKTDGKTFWKSIKPFFSNCNAIESKLSLKHNGQLIQDCYESTAQTFLTNISILLLTHQTFTIRNLYNSQIPLLILCYRR